MSKLIDDFEETFKVDLLSNKIKRFNITNSITIGDDEGSLFNLQSPDVVTENSVDIVNRIVLTKEMVQDILINPYKGRALFDQIKDEMEDLNCPYYTFTRPCGKGFLTFREGDDNIELRACGLRQKD